MICAEYTPRIWNKIIKNIKVGAFLASFLKEIWMADTSNIKVSQFILVFSHTGRRKLRRKMCEMLGYSRGGGGGVIWGCGAVGPIRQLNSQC
jgi:hypothetical protein